MKKILLYVAFAMAVSSLSSCKEDLEIWDSATLDYSGRFMYQLQDSSGATVYVDYAAKNEIRIFNTAANLPNEVWIDDIAKKFPFKCKFNLTGNSESFKSKSLNFADLNDNTITTVKDYGFTLPTVKPLAANETVTEPRGYLRCAVTEGKIIRNAATTLGGNKADSIFIRVRLYSGSVTFVSYSIPVAQRVNPNIEEFAWKFSTMNYDPVAYPDEYYVISGHRFTGLIEDNYSK